MIYAYLRVSTQDQVLENQLFEIQSFAVGRGIVIDRYVEEHVSGTTAASGRKLGWLLRMLRPGDTLIVSEISRLSRRMTEIMTIMQRILDRKVTLYSIKESYSFENSINSKVLCFAFGIAAEIERDLISQRTKEALAVRRRNGVVLGRPRGSGKLSRLSADDRQRIICSPPHECRALCRSLGISPSSYYKLRREAGGRASGKKS